MTQVQKKEGAQPVSEDVKQGAVAEKEGTRQLSEDVKQRAVTVLVFGIFQAVLQHVAALQSDVVLFNQALGGNEAATSRALATTNALTGIVGLFVNQLGGKLSDAFGRRQFFLTGPLINIACVLAMLRDSKSVFVLSVARVLRSIFITFSGTMMCNTALADMLPGEEMKQVLGKIAAGVGCAVIGGPYIESFALKLSKGNPVAPFKVMMGLAMVQLAMYAKFMPETLGKKKDLGSVSDIVASMNPFSFVKLYMGNNAVLKKLVTTQTFQMCTDGKVTSDLFQMWSRNNLGWTAAQMRDFVAIWGGSVFAGSAVVQPALLKKMSSYGYTVVTNASVGAGLFIHGLAENWVGMWGGLPFLVPGVNGGAAQAIKALTADIAKKEGYGNGEFQAWTSNLRALAQAIQIVIIGAWYARCRERGRYSRTAWFWASFVGAGIPQLIMLTLSKKDFESPVASSKSD